MKILNKASTVLKRQVKSSLLKNKIYPKISQLQRFSVIQPGFRAFSSDLEPQQTKTDQHELRETIPRGKHRVPYTLKVGDVSNGFKVTSIDRIEMFDINAYQLVHEKTGTRYLHLDCADLDNVFAVLFKTPPDDHTGKPHILEHLTTSGSKNFPVRDPFMNMLKRSLNTFMNAWTGSDWTMYPFSTQNAKDFRNLMSVYLDMSFFPRLDYLDFSQEGHRLEFREWNDPSTELEYKGVVYNEMKGAMSNPEDAFVHRLNENLFEKAQYKFNSGGEPKHIPELEYQDLVDFHDKYYHPSNATFLSYGDMDLTKHLEYINNVVIAKFDRKEDIPSAVLKEERFTVPKEKEIRFMPDLMSEPDQQVKLGVSYLCNEIKQHSYETFCMTILSHLMFDGPNTPFYKNIIEAGIAPNFCPGYGYDNTTQETTFTMGVQGIKLEDLKTCEKALYQTLKEVSENGIEERYFDTVLHQIEFDAKKTKDHYGLQLLSHMIPQLLHGDSPLDFFKINEFSQRIREDFKKGDFFQNMIKKYLLNNTHKLKLVMIPDTEVGPKEEQAEKQKLDQLKKLLTDEEKQSIVQDAYKLRQHQEIVQDLSILPTLELSDIPRQIEFTDHDIKHLGKVKTWWFEQPTNGINYVRIKANLKNLPEHLRLFVPMFAELFQSIGTKNYRYDDFNDRLLNCSNGIDVKVDKYSFIGNNKDIMDRNENMLLSIGFLDRNIDKAFDCLTELLATPNFDEPNNISDLIKMESINKANNIGNKGHTYATTYSQSGLKAVARSFETLRSDIFFCQYAAEVLKTSNPIAILKDAIICMTEIASYVFREENMEIAVHGNKKKFAMLQMKLEMMLNQIKNSNSRYTERIQNIDSLSDEFSKPAYYKNFFKTPLAVNMCAESMLGVNYKDADNYAAQLVLGELLTFSYLIPTIREKGGAYGAGCRINEDGLFTFFSYRDPKIEQTYDSFEKALGDVCDKEFSESQLKEAKLLAFQKLDKVLEPSLKGLLNFARGYTDEHKMKVRLRALELTREDIVGVAEKYMMKAIEEGKTSRVVFGSQNAALDELEQKGWNIFNPIDFLSYQYFDKYNQDVKQV